MKKLKKFICIFAIGFSTTTFLLSYEETKKLIDDFIITIMSVFSKILAGKLQARCPLKLS